MFVNRTYEQVKELIKKENVGGWMGSVAQRDFLFNLAKCSKVAAEIGSYHGLSSAIVGFGMVNRKQCKYYCVDTYKSTNEEYRKTKLYGISTLEIFLEHRKHLNLESTLIPIVGNSQDKKIIDSVPNDLDFVYIDGSHETKDVYLDIKNWTPKVAVNGLILFHDYGWETVKKGVNQAIKEGIIYPYVSWQDFGICKRVRE